MKGKKCHILVDTQGLLMDTIIHCAYAQGRDGVLLMAFCENLTQMEATKARSFGGRRRKLFPA